MALYPLLLLHLLQHLALYDLLLKISNTSIKRLWILVDCICFLCVMLILASIAIAEPRFMLKLFIKRKAGSFVQDLMILLSKLMIASDG